MPPEDRISSQLLNTEWEVENEKMKDKRNCRHRRTQKQPVIITCRILGFLLHRSRLDPQLFDMVSRQKCILELRSIFLTFKSRFVVAGAHSQVTPSDTSALPSEALNQSRCPSLGQIPAYPKHNNK